ncbi:hypothetical protein ScPMuIL_016035 [Solemya velum]
MAKYVSELLPLRVLELYSGIGGMHCALNESGIDFEITAAIDINPMANKLYRCNFPKTNALETGIEALTEKKLDSMQVDMVVMSPPCQPFTRVGKQKDADDGRTSSFFHFLQLLRKMKKCPSYILVENVRGFETSRTHEKLLETLNLCDYLYQEFLLTPLQFGIPNARLRYYLLAKKRPMEFGFKISPEVMMSVPTCCEQMLIHKYSKLEVTCFCRETSFSEEQGVSKCDKDQQTKVKDNSECNISRPKLDIETSENPVNIGEGVEPTGCLSVPSKENSIINKSLCETSQSNKVPCSDNKKCIAHHGQNMRQAVDEDHKPYPGCQLLGHFLEDKPVEYFNKFLLSDKELKRFVIMDIANSCLRKTTCFTKRYGHFTQGAGSIFQMTTDSAVMNRASDLKVFTEQQHNRDDWGETELSTLHQLKLRYFTPQEIANLLCFPKSYCFPSDMTNIQLYRLLGNSLNVHVVGVLLQLLTMGDNS